MTCQMEEDHYPDEEAQRRFEAALRAALRTPHKLMKALPRKRDKAERKPEPKKPATREPAD